MGDHSAAISIVTWFLLVTSTITTIARICIRWSTSMKFHKDDLCALIALAGNIGAGIAISIAANNGLGTPVSVLSPDNVRIVQKSLYSNGILFVIVELFSRLSVIFLMQRIFISKAHQLPTVILGVLVVIQGLSFLIAACFSCEMPKTWAIGSGQCFDLAAFWLVYGILDIATDVALVAIPCLMATTVQITLENKIIVAGCFSMRLFVVGASGTQLGFVNDFSSQDPTGDLWTWFFVGQVVQTLTIISSCIPYLGQFMKAFPSGMLQFQSDETMRRGNASRTTTLRTNTTHASSIHTRNSYVLKGVKGAYDRTSVPHKIEETPSRDSQEEWLKNGTHTSVRSVAASPTPTGESIESVRQGRESIGPGIVRSIDFETNSEHQRTQYPYA